MKTEAEEVSVPVNDPAHEDDLEHPPEFTDLQGDVKILAMSGSALGYLTVAIDNVQMSMLIDSSASYSTIDYTVYTSLETQPTLHQFTRPVWCAGLS